MTLIKSMEQTPVTTGNPEVDQLLNTRLQQAERYIGQMAADFNEKMEWFRWESGAFYPKGAVVMVDGYLMVANKPTSEYPAPVPTGSPFWVDEIPPAVVWETPNPIWPAAPQLLMGQRYTLAETGWIAGLRVRTIAGNEYRLYTVSDPLNFPVVTEQARFTANDSNVWVELAANPVFLSAGFTFDLIATISQPDPTVTTETAEYDYIKPNIETPALFGQCTHSNRELNIMRFHTDAIPTTGTINWGTKVAGDLIRVEGVEYAIQAPPTFNAGANDWTVEVAPATQLTTTGVKTFVAEVVTDTPFTYHRAVNHYQGNATVSGIIGESTSTVTIDDNAYGVDVLVQQATVPTDWDFLAYTDVSSASAGNLGYTSINNNQSLVTWDDLRFPATAVNPPGAASDPQWDGTLPGWLFASNLTEQLQFVVQLPHNWVAESDLKPHVHWTKTTSAAGNVFWRLEYKWAPIGEVIDASWTTLDVSTTVGGTPDNDTADEHLISAFGTISATGKGFSDMLVFKVSRIGTDAADTYGADARFLEFDIHHQRKLLATQGEFS